MSEASSPSRGSCRYHPFASNSTASSSVLNSFIYAAPSVHERLAYGLLVPEADRAVEMAGYVDGLEMIIEALN
jgi:hypothetical protein